MSTLSQKESDKLPCVGKAYKEYVTWLVLCDSVEEAKKYAVLSEVWELP